MSESFLSQEEVDALLEGVTGESQKAAEEVFETGEIRNYDISSQERIVRGRMPTMEVVNERFARNFRIGLFTSSVEAPRYLLVRYQSVGTVHFYVSWLFRRISTSWPFALCAVVV